MLVPAQRCTEHFEENCQTAQTILRHDCEGTGIRQAYEEGYLTKQNRTGCNWCTRPVIAIEMGFLSNEKDDALLPDASFPPTMARGLFEGIPASFEDRS